MPPLFALLIAAVGASIAFLIASERRRARMRVWREAAQAAGLSEIQEQESLFGASLDGRAGDARVRLETYQRGKNQSGTRIVVSNLGHGIGGLSLRREGLGTAFEKAFVGEREIEIGAPEFDDEFYVQGQAALALALLTPEARRRLTGLLRGRARVPGREPIPVRASLSDGVLEVEVRERAFWSVGENVSAVLGDVLGVASHLAAPRDVAGRMAENARVEPEPGARLQLLLALAREFPQHPSTRPALLAGREDPIPEVRLRAAMALGEEGRETLRALVTAETTPDSCAARAVTALGADAPADLVETTLRRALASGRGPVAEACLESLGRLGRAGAEGLMVEALRSEGMPVCVAAARALGRVGTASAVVPLRDAMAARGGPLRSAARQAIAEIQARLEGAAPGQLSLAAAEAGALSFPEGEPGRLSLADGETPEAVRAPAEEQETGDEGSARKIPRAPSQKTPSG